MDAELSKAYPQFGSLVSRIKEKLSDEGASPNVQKAFDQAQRNLVKARSDYMTNKILYTELHEILTDLEVCGQENSLNSDQKKLKDILSKTLAHAELHDYLHFSPSATSTSTLFGLTEDHLDRHNPTKTRLPELIQIIIPILEEKLLQKCEDLYAYFDPSNSLVPSSDGLLAAKAHSLPAQVEHKKTLLAREQVHLRQTRQQRDTQFWSYFQKLLEYLSILETLIKDFKCGSQAETDTVTVEHLRALCRVTCLKVRSASLQVMCDTYTAESVKALKAVSGHLDTATSEAKRELSATNQSLHAFRRLGPEFAALARQVSQLQHELHNKQWGLEKFGQSAAPASALDSTSVPGVSGSSTAANERVTPELQTSSASFPFTGSKTAEQTHSAMSTFLDSTLTAAEAGPDQESPLDMTVVNSHKGVRGAQAHHHRSPGDSLSEAFCAMNIEESSISSEQQQEKSQHGKKVTFQ